MSSEIVIIALLVIFLFLRWLFKRQTTPHRHNHKKYTIANKKSVNSEAFGKAPDVVNANEIITPHEAEAFAPGIVPKELSNFKLIMLEDLDASIAEEIVQMTEAIRQPHPMLNKLTRGVNGPDELIEIVKSDPEITAKILRIVNSAAYSLAHPITSINHAITYLGISIVKDTATQFAIRNSIAIKTPEQKEAFSKVWVASHVASTAGLLIAQFLGDERASEISTQALLSYLGDLAILAARPELAQNYLKQQSLFERINDEQIQLHANSAIVGSMLGSRWELPAQVEQSLKLSLLPMSLDPEHYPYAETNMRRTLLCYIACRIGDLVAFNGVTDIGEIDFSGQDGLEFFYLPEHIQKAGLDRINLVMTDAAFRKKINQFISQVGKW